MEDKMENAVITKIDDFTWQFTEKFLGENVYCYLLIGKEKALLIDTAYGFTDIASAVKELTDLPLIVVNTHGHFDHITGNYRFPDAYLHIKDHDLYRKHTDQKYLESLFEGIIGGIKGKAAVLAYRNRLVSMLDHRVPDVLSLPECGYFELGERRVEIIETPGHTQGSVSLLDTKNGWLFSGDTCGDVGMLLHFPEATSIKEFHQTIDRIRSLVKEGRVTRNYPSHQTSPAPLNKLEYYDELLGRMEKGQFSEKEWETGKAEHNGITIEFNRERTEEETGMKKEKASFMDKFGAKVMTEMMFRPSGPVRPSKKTVMERTMRDTGFDLEDFETWEKEDLLLENGDVTIPASVYPLKNAKGIAILAHGFGQNRYVLIPQAELFRKKGWSLIMFDQRHFGASKAKNGTFSVKEADDLIALAKWAKERFGEDTKIITLGVSMGAMTVMNAIGRTDLFDAAIEDCGPSRLEKIGDLLYRVVFGKSNPYFIPVLRDTAKKYGLELDKISPVDSVAVSDTPLLAIHSEGDSTVPVQCVYEIKDAMKNEKSRIEVFGNYEHAFSICDKEHYRKTVETFLNDVFEGE